MTFSSKAIAACALVTLLCIGILSFRITIVDEKDRQWVTHTHLVIQSLEAVLADINEAETGQRGYILTGQDKYLQPYKTGYDQVFKEIQQLRALTFDNVVQQDAINRLEPLLRARLVGLADRIEVRKRKGLLAGIEAVSDPGNHGEELMNQARSLIGEMQGREQNLLSARLRAAASSTRQTKIVIVLGNALAIIFLLTAGVVIHQQMLHRNLAEENLRLANDDLERRAVELADTNAELESFSYSIAHDLRAPLRHISGYSNVLLEDKGVQLNSEARRHLEKVDQGAKKMGRLVDDLLSLAKIGRQELSLQTMPLDLLLRQVVEELAPECSGRDIEWKIDPLFDADCDPGLMKQVFVNLLSNAVKYTRKCEHAVIQVGPMNSGGPHGVFVRDNGVGFEMRYAGKLFGVFQRLHSDQDFEGTGVGLAIVQRIIRKHGGRIWAEAELGEGATFRFTLGGNASRHQLNPERSIIQEAIHVGRS